ncbi:MAG: hypothetical protein IPN49_16495 [Saprospiraceae bacterium]|nr:hypothetical protein [Saprospiraceae bacterium]
MVLEDDQLPPVFGKNCVVLPIQIEDGPSSNGVVAPKTVTGVVAFEIHPVEELVNLKVASP